MAGVNCLNEKQEEGFYLMFRFRLFMFAVIAGAFVSASGVAYASNHLKLKVDASCNKGAAIFKVQNKGDRWPKSGRFEVYSVEDKSLILQRKFRLAAGQKASFRVKDVAASYGEVGLWVQPSWYQRGFKYDATIVCH
jgi:hypothetical protein